MCSLVLQASVTSSLLAHATLTVQRNYTLVCEPGSYALTGTDVVLGNTKSYTLVCEAGSYSLTGTDVSLEVQRNYTLVCETGSYALTGTNVSLVILRNYILACSAGTYSLTGTNAALTSALQWHSKQVHTHLTGTNADLYRVGYGLSAGSCSLTGTDASLTSHRIFALGMGSYVAGWNCLRIVHSLANTGLQNCDNRI